jgi:nucleotide-binding universal stress UspA family protein
MATQKILVPCDFSTEGKSALEYATKLARETGAKLLIAHVQELPLIYGDGIYPYYAFPEPDTSEAYQLLDDVKPDDPAVTYEHRLLTGDPAARLAEAAEAEHVDLIVMSSHGRSGLRRVLLGSVAESALRRASRPVLIVKPNGHAEPLHLRSSSTDSPVPACG